MKFNNTTKAIDQHECRVCNQWFTPGIDAGKVDYQDDKCMCHKCDRE